MSLLSYGNGNGSLSNTKLILKLLGWLPRCSIWELCIYPIWCQYMSQGPFQQVGNVFPHVPCTGEVKNLGVSNLTCTYGDHSLASVPHLGQAVYVLPKRAHLEDSYAYVKPIRI